MPISSIHLTPEALRLIHKKESERGCPLAAERRIQDALSRAALRRGRYLEGVEVHDPATAAMLAEDLARFEHGTGEDARDAGDDHSALFREWFRRTFEFFFADGPHPGLAVRRIYMLARRYYPELIEFMNGTDLGLMFGETRSAQSYRINLLFDGLKAAGVKGNRGGGCKREGTRSVFAASATGNTNRRATGKKRRKKNRIKKKKP